MAATCTGISSTFRYVSKVAAIRWRACALALLTEELHRLSLSPWHHRTVAGSYQFCAKLRNHLSRGWGHIIMCFHFLESACCDQRLVLLFWAYQGLSAWLIGGDNVEISYCVVLAPLHLRLRAFQKLPQSGPMCMHPFLQVFTITITFPTWMVRSLCRRVKS